MTEVTFLDSSGLNALIAGEKRLAEQGTQLALVITSPIVLRTFEIARLRDYFTILGARSQLDHHGSSNADHADSTKPAS